MRQFSWSAANEIFLAQIDAEHQHLFRIAEELQQAVESNAPAGEVREHLGRLTTHAEEHFTHEEWLMDSVGYPSYGWHRNQHDTARRRLNLFVPLVEAGDQEAAELLLDFLAGWLHEHTTLTDRMMGAYVRNYERSHAASALERWGEPPSIVQEKAAQAESVPQ